MLEAVKQNRNSFPDAVPEAEADREFMLEAVKQNRNSLPDAAPEAEADRELVLEAVKQEGVGHEFVTDRDFIKADSEYIFEAESQHDRRRNRT